MKTFRNRLARKEIIDCYNVVIEDQKAQGIVEEAPSTPVGKVFYIPRNDVVRETATSTRLRVVYDASAKATPKSPSLNEVSINNRFDADLRLLSMPLRWVSHGSLASHTSR